MAAAAASCALSKSQGTALPIVPCSVPHWVHLRFDYFLLGAERQQRPKFRIRRGPVQVRGLTAVLRAFAPAVDADSNCGFFLNLFGSPLLQGNFSGTLRRLQLEVEKSTGIMVSLGAATSKVAAAVASRMARPGELLVVEPGSEARFLAALPVEALHAMGGVDSSELRRCGITTVAELRRVPCPVLVSAYGEVLGRRTWRISRALDAQPESQGPLSAAPRSWLRAAAAAVVAVL